VEVLPETINHSSIGNWFLSSSMVVGWWASCEVCKVVGPVRASSEDALFIFAIVVKEQKERSSSL